MSGNTALITLIEFNDLSVEDKKTYLKMRFEDAKKLGINLIDNSSITIANVQSISSVRKDDVLSGIYVKNFDKNGDFLKKVKGKVKEEVKKEDDEEIELQKPNKSGAPSVPPPSPLSGKQQAATMVDLSDDTITRLAAAIQGIQPPPQQPPNFDTSGIETAISQIQPPNVDLTGVEQAISNIPQAQIGDITVDTQGVEKRLDELLKETQKNSVSYYMQPFRNMKKEEIAKEFEKIGINFMQSIDKDTEEDLLRRLDFEKAIQAQAKALSDYKLNNPPYIERDFTRAGFDLFYKVGDTSYNGTPLSKEYKFIQKEIPKISIRFDPKTGFYKCKQGEDVYIAKNFSVADKWSLKGGFYEYELSKLREMKIKMESLNYKTAPIFKARKL